MIVMNAVRTPIEAFMPKPVTLVDFEVNSEAKPIDVVTDVSNVETPTSFSVNRIATSFSNPFLSLFR